MQTNVSAFQIPFLSLGADVGKRETLVSGFSKISGEFRIEEVEGNDGKVFRRLIFLNNQFVVQSEALVKTSIFEIFNAKVLPLMIS